MSSKLYFLNFEGYWRENEVSTIPNRSGVYCVYTSTYNPSTVSRGTLSLRSLIYIKGAGDVRASITESENWPVWRKHLRESEELCFSVAAVEPSELPRVEAGLIFHHKPPQDSEYHDSFPFEPTTVINTSGRNYQLDAQCIVPKALSEPSDAPDTEEPRR